MSSFIVRLFLALHLRHRNEVLLDQTLLFASPLTSHLRDLRSERFTVPERTKSSTIARLLPASASSRLAAPRLHHGFKGETCLLPCRILDPRILEFHSPRMANVYSSPSTPSSPPWLPATPFSRRDDSSNTITR